MRSSRGFSAVNIDILSSGLARAASESAFSESAKYISSTPKLLADQYLTAVSANMEQVLEKLGSIDGPKPTIVYAYTDNDYMVDNLAAKQQFQKNAERFELPFVAVNIPKAIHSRPELTHDEYTLALRAIEPILANLREREIADYRFFTGKGITTPIGQ